MSRSLRVVAFALSFVVLSTPAAVRAEPWDAASWLGRLLTKLTAIWSENGCSIDPSGHCGTAPVANGCSLDPDGNCGTEPRAIWADNGCSIDPDGHCGTAPLVNGCGLDPNGLCADRW